MVDFFMNEVWPLVLFLWPYIKVPVYFVIIIVPLLITMAYFTYWERKVIGWMQLRRGPTVVGPLGLLQPFADGMKLFLKETLIPSGANPILFLLAPIITFSLAMIAWVVIPFDEGWVVADINVGILYIFAISSLGVYGIVMAGWASNSKYAFLGALRSAAQMISYEVSMGFVIVTVLLLVGSLNLSDIVRAQAGGFWNWHVMANYFVLFPMMIVFLVSMLAETNRTPFDLPEAEAELVAGFFVEYSSFPFAMFFLGEYLNMMLMGGIMSILFFGGWQAPIP
ncbi:MAG: NADH-quinone oxidoreductase subunit H, partial [Alphaproteobacteria bacterium]|nr:NADH-quinone oxidoreductase subunit H [Alphaproteobacteria bacterium]